MWVNSVSLVFVKELSISLTIKDRLKKKRIFVSGHINQMDSEYLENYIWFYAHANYLNQGVVLWGFDFFAVVAVKNTPWR